MNIDKAINQVNLNKINNLESLSRQKLEDRKLKQTCVEFESIFIKQMLNSMKSTINKSGLIKESMGEKLFDDMLYDEYAQKMAKTSQFGIADMMYKQLSKYSN